MLKNQVKIQRLKNQINIISDEMLNHKNNGSKKIMLKSIERRKYVIAFLSNKKEFVSWHTLKEKFNFRI